MDQRRPKNPKMNRMMTTAPTTQIIRFTIHFLCLLRTFPFYSCLDSASVRWRTFARNPWSHASPASCRAFQEGMSLSRRVCCARHPMLGRLLATQLYGVGPVDPVTIAAAAAIFVAVAILASLRPAARAAGTAPLDALRAG